MSDNKQYILYGILAGSILFNIGHIFSSDSEEEQAAMNNPDQEQVLPEDIEEGIAQQAQEEPQETLSDEWIVVKAQISHSLTRTFSKAGVDKADALSMVFSRLFIWDFKMTRDLMKGDQVEVIYKIGDDGHPHIGAARLVSKN